VPFRVEERGVVTGLNKRSIENERGRVTEIGSRGTQKPPKSSEEYKTQSLGKNDQPRVKVKETWQQKHKR